MNTIKNPLITACTREQARQFNRKAKALGVKGLSSPVKNDRGSWVVGFNRPVLTLNFK